MPRDTQRANVLECEQMGAKVTLIDGMITDCGAEVAPPQRPRRLVRPSRPSRNLTGPKAKKTMGYELAEQFAAWTLPDVILYPTGGGTGWWACGKLSRKWSKWGLIGSKRPRMFTVAGERLRPHRPRVRGGRKIRGGISQRSPARLRPASAESHSRLSDARGAARLRRGRRGGAR